MSGRAGGMLSATGAPARRDRPSVPLFKPLLGAAGTPLVPALPATRLIPAATAALCWLHPPVSGTSPWPSLHTRVHLLLRTRHSQSFAKNSQNHQQGCTTRHPCSLRIGKTSAVISGHKELFSPLTPDALGSCRKGRILPCPMNHQLEHWR